MVVFELRESLKLISHKNVTNRKVLIFFRLCSVQDLFAKAHNGSFPNFLFFFFLLFFFCHNERNKLDFLPSVVLKAEQMCFLIHMVKIRFGHALLWKKNQNRKLWYRPGQPNWDFMNVDVLQCGNLAFFLPLWLYVKSILADFRTSWSAI